MPSSSMSSLLTLVVIDPVLAPIFVGIIPIYHSSPIYYGLPISNYLSCLLKEQLLEPALNLTVHCCGLEFQVLNGYDQKSFDEERGLNCELEDDGILDKLDPMKFDIFKTLVILETMSIVGLIFDDTSSS
ncbi:hypothetical protein Tco_0663061 [Tanacetum coccineum]